MTLTLVKPSPREEIQNHLHISHSQISTYLICPAKYGHQYVYGTPSETKPAALPFGSAMHKAVENYYRITQETGEVIPVENLITVFNTCLDTEIEKSDVPWSFKNGDTFETLRNMGADLLKLFHAEAAPQNIFAVELPFTVPVPDLTNGGDLPVMLAGVMDLVESDQNGVHCVVELKTSAQRYTDAKLEFDTQATTYSYAMSKMGLTTTEKSTLIRYDVLLKTKKPAMERYYVTRTTADHRRLIQLINEVLRAIEHRIFYRNPGWQCGDCQFKRACFNG